MKRFNQWFGELPIEEQRILREDKWMLAERAYKEALTTDRADGAKLACSDGLSDFASLADKLEKEGAFLDNPHDHPTDRAGGKAYKKSAKRIREIVEKAKGR